MISWIKKLIGIVKNYDSDRETLRVRIAQAEQVIRDRTDVHADVHYKSENQIIVVGRYKNRDYVQTYSVCSGDFHALIQQLRDMERYGHISRIDAPPAMRAVFEHDLTN